MTSLDWGQIFTNFYNWCSSSQGIYLYNGEPTLPYAIKNFFFSGNTDYSHNNALATLSEGQSYGALYALWSNDLYAFNKIYLHYWVNHRLTAANVAASKNMNQWVTGWHSEFDGITDYLGKSVRENNRNSLNLGGWVWSKDFSSTGGNQTGIASTNPATDGDVVMAGLLLLAYERWNIPSYKTVALLILADLVQYCVRRCGSRYVLGMGPYKGPDGFETPALKSIELNETTVFPGDDNIILDDAGLATGDSIGFIPIGGATMPGGITGQGGSNWPKYFVRVNGSFNIGLYPTRADALANTNKINITSTGSGTVYVFPFEVAGGVVATNPSYLWAHYFRLFAQYDTTNAAVWSALTTDAYADIQYSMDTVSLQKMPTYLIGVAKSNGARQSYAANGDAQNHQLDAVRVAMNLAMDGSTEALNILKSRCDLSSGKWVPKTGINGGIWRFYLYTGLIPDKLLNSADTARTFNQSQVDMTTDVLTAASGQTWNFRVGAAVTFSTTVVLPVGLNNSSTFYARPVTPTTISIHTSLAGAQNNTGRINFIDQGFGTHTISSTEPMVQWYTRYPAGVPTPEGISPYGAAQILAWIFALNGKVDAEMFYLSLPSWLKQQVSGAFVENNSDYYPQYLWGVFAALMGKDIQTNTHERGYLVFAGGTQSANISSAMAVLTTIQTTLGRDGYAKVLLNTTNTIDVALPIVGPKAFNALNSGQKSSVVKTLPDGNWLVAA
jgi:endo-1,4-beta-D-glucanase Y